MDKGKAVVAINVTVLLGTVLACTSLPPPRSVHRDALTAIELRTDPRAGPGHSHPATVSPEQMARILAGIQVQSRKDPVMSLLTRGPQTSPAFSGGEVYALAPHLSKALAMASPRELITFYRRYSDVTIGLAVTSGGLFVREGHLYFVLANFRTLPSETMSRGIPAAEMDPINEPLLSLRPDDFAVSFLPTEAVVHPVHGQWTWNYPDSGKVLVLDLTLAIRSSPPPSGAPLR